MPQTADIAVSPLPRATYGNGAELYARESAAGLIAQPTREVDLSDRTALDRHMEHVFRSA